MKKLLAMLLALVMVCGLATVAFAAGETYAAVTPASVTISKTYVDGSNTTAEVFPAENLTFTCKEAVGTDNKGDSITNVPAITITDATDKSNPRNLTVTFPKYTVAGQYTYTFTEDNVKTAGVTYEANEIKISVLVYYDNVGMKLVAETQVGILKDGKKVPAITNTYKTGSLNFKKTISGNLADTDDVFTFEVTLISDKYVGHDATDGIAISFAKQESGDYAGKWVATKTYTLTGGDGFTISDIPDGVQYIIKETDSGKYTPNHEQLTGTIGNAETKVSINNELSTTIDTGIALDSMPFVILLAVCAVAAVMFVIKRRRVEE